MPALPEGDKSYEFIAIDDFSPGIYSEWYASSGIQSAPDGAAQATGTFRCCAGTTGALIPGPRKIASAPFYNNAFSFAGVTISDTNFVQADHFAHVLAMRVLPASYPPGGVAFNQPAMLMSGINDHLCLMVQFYTNAGAAPPTKGYGWAVIHNAAGFINSAAFGPPSQTNFTDANGVALVGKRSQVDFTNFTSSTFTFAPVNQNNNVPGAVLPTNGLQVYGTGSMDLTRANVASPTTPGNPTLAYSYMPFYLNSTTATLNQVFPKNSTPQADSTDNIIFTNVAQIVFCHQDRTVGLLQFGPAQQIQEFGGNNKYTDPSEYVVFTKVNDYSHSAGFFQIVNENPTGYGSWVSMNANQMLLVKQVGGGVSVTGALENPTITRLPGLVSIGGPKNIGCLTGQGTYIYGTSLGIHAWSGGDTSQLVSPQLSPNSWVPTPPGVNVGVVGTFAYAQPFVFAPNNLLYDTRKRGWWNYENPATVQYCFHQANGGGNVVCTPAILPVAGGFDTEAFAWYDPRQGANSYQWTSQPLPRTRGRVLTFREASLVAAGQGTITLTLTGLAEETVVTKTVPVNTSTTPQAVHIPDLETRASDAVLTIQAVAADPRQPAPTVYRIQLAAYEGRTIRNVL